MYGLIGKMKVVSGQRDALIAVLLEGVSGMPGCLSYVVAQDPTDADAIWITEVWDNQGSHQASLSLPSVQRAISRGKPLIAGFGERFETKPGLWSWRARLSCPTIHPNRNRFAARHPWRCVGIDHFDQSRRRRDSPSTISRSSIAP